MPVWVRVQVAGRDSQVILCGILPVLARPAASSVGCTSNCPPVGSADQHRLCCMDILSRLRSGDHMLTLRELQDETGGIQSFIPLPFHPRTLNSAIYLG